MPQALRDQFGVTPLLDQVSSVGVTKVMETEPVQAERHDEGPPHLAPKLLEERLDRQAALRKRVTPWRLEETPTLPDWMPQAPNPRLGLAGISTGSHHAPKPASEVLRDTMLGKLRRKQLGVHEEGAQHSGSV